MFYLGCPVLWVSKPQSEISLSTVEAEYMALSIAIRDMIPFTDQVTELTTVFNQEKLDVKLHSALFEDNDRALKLAIISLYCPRIKHIAIKYNYFIERVKQGMISIVPKDTTEQIVDQFTKGLQVGTFEYLRANLLEWRATS